MRTRRPLLWCVYHLALMPTESLAQSAAPPAESDCTCKWTVLEPEGTRWSGITGDITTVQAATVQACQDACCEAKANAAGCVAFRCAPRDQVAEAERQRGREAERQR